MDSRIQILIRIRTKCHRSETLVRNFCFTYLSLCLPLMLQDHVVFTSQFLMLAESLVMNICLVTCLLSSLHLLKSYCPSSGLCRVQVPVWYVGRIPSDDHLPSQVSPPRLRKSYYPSSGPCCVQVTVWYVGWIPGDDHLPGQVSLFRLLKSYYTFLGSCCVQVPVWYVGQIPGDDHLPNQVSPFRLLKSYYTFLGPCCVQSQFGMSGDDHLSSIVSLFCLLKSYYPSSGLCCVQVKSQFGIWGGSLVMTACLVKCLHSAFKR
jgi:hypothetical protein